MQLFAESRGSSDPGRAKRTCVQSLEMRKVADFKRKKAEQSGDSCANRLLARRLLRPCSFSCCEVYVQFLQKRVAVRTRASCQNGSKSMPSAYIACLQHEANGFSNRWLSISCHKSSARHAKPSELVRTALLATEL